MDDFQDGTSTAPHGRRAALIQVAAHRGLLGSKGHQIGGRFPDVLIDEASQRHQR